MAALICVIIALVLFAIATANVAVPKINVVAAGLFFLALAQVIGKMI